jgi:spore maturation protein CgeB
MPYSYPYGCDVSFIGTYSPKKEKLLAALKEALPSIHLKIWGDQWFRATAPSIKSSIQGRSITGDLYALAIQCSKINLGILNEQVTGASSGDLITSRTFHIPGSSGFMLHERNEESVQYFKEGEEAGFFDGEKELVEQVSLYLGNDSLRDRVAMAGYKRALADHSLDERAKKIIAKMREL